MAGPATDGPAIDYRGVYLIAYTTAYFGRLSNTPQSEIMWGVFQGSDRDARVEDLDPVYILRLIGMHDGFNLRPARDAESQQIQLPPETRPVVGASPADTGVVEGRPAPRCVPPLKTAPPTLTGAAYCGRALTTPVSSAEPREIGPGTTVPRGPWNLYNKHSIIRSIPHLTGKK
jgi:hypothetical protein